MAERRRRKRSETMVAGLLVVSYVRVSTESQDLGPDAQREAIERWCAVNGAEHLASYEDLGVSGATPIDRRPGLLAAVERLRELGATVLLVAKRDRLARDVMVSAVVERLVERSGGRVLAADGTGNGSGPEAQLMRTLIDAFAQYERALIRARTKSALAVKRGRGERTGRLPFGFQLGADGVHLEPEPREQAALERMRALHEQGRTQAQIADVLNAEQLFARGRRGQVSRWHQTMVGRLLARAA